MLSLQLIREKTARQNVFHFAGAIGKTGVPAKFILWGDSTVGLSYKRPEGV